MKIGSLNKVKVNKLSLALIALLCGTIILWAWERTPTTSTYIPSVEHLEVIVSEPVIVAGGSVHATQQKQLDGEDLPERTQNLSYKEKNLTIPETNSVIDGSEQNIGDANGANQKQSANEDLTESVQTLPSVDKGFAPPQVNSLTQNSSEKKTGDANLREVPAVRKDCNYAKGKWVEDEKRPLYSGLGCKQWLSEMWACRLMKRIDFSYESFRWQPQGCNMPEFSGHEFLRRMQDKTIAFVGDSLGRQQFQSLMCMVTAGKPYHEVEDVGKEYRLVKARGATRPDGWAYRFKRTNTTILYYWSASLCELEPLNVSDPATSYAMHLDRPATFLKQYLDRFDVLVLNTGHHWNRLKFKNNRWEMYVNGMPNTDRKTAGLGNAKNLTIFSIVRWLDSQLPHHPRLKAFFRTISPRHFVNGEWNTGGSCDNSVPLASGNEVVLDSSKDFVAESAVRGTTVNLLDITALSELRDETHISKYSAKSANGAYDCLHWCLPGIPDTWNELLYAQIL